MIESKRWGSAILYGVISIFLMGLVVSLLFSLLLKFTSLTEQSIQWVVTTLGFIAVFIGGFVAGGKGKEKGLLLGALTAIIYTSIILLFNFLGFGQTLSAKNWMYHGGFLLIAMLGGVIGVNISSNRSA
ncbi:TIGR04086 family membrane protein [Bacillus kexueae]|uniref:TIGR04086 family membrane protein n=1 Tax=Aeribacillus kexueae TaxID=2078952 RepID=UPI001FAF439C|nr:TIGR04086 family membrane protein [Bacillus kexueae]